MLHAPPSHLPPCPGKNPRKSHIALRRKQYGKSRQGRVISGTVVYQRGWFTTQHPHSLPGGQKTLCPLQPLSVHHDRVFCTFCIRVVLLLLNFSTGQHLGRIVCHRHLRLPAVIVQVTTQRHSRAFRYTLKDPD